MDLKSTVLIKISHTKKTNIVRFYSYIESKIQNKQTKQSRNRLIDTQKLPEKREWGVGKNR